MAPKKNNLPLTLEQDRDSTGTITYANEVIAIISGVAANEVAGIAGMCTSGGIADVFGRNKNITKGVKVENGSEEASVDLYVVVEYGTPIQTAAADVQENVRTAIETMTGLHVVRVDVHVQGVSFEKENKEMQAGLESASEATGEKLESKAEAKPVEITWDTTSPEESADTPEAPAQDTQDAPEESAEPSAQPEASVQSEE